MTYGEAKIFLQSTGISTGLIMLDPGVTDTIAGYVYWQNPPPYDAQSNVNVLRVGQLVDIKLSVAKPERPVIPEKHSEQ
jgi:hypothetical protein